MEDLPVRSKGVQNTHLPTSVIMLWAVFDGALVDQKACLLLEKVFVGGYMSFVVLRKTKG